MLVMAKDAVLEALALVSQGTLVPTVMSLAVISVSLAPTALALSVKLAIMLIQ
jgi:hypothetical protein